MSAIARLLWREFRDTDPDTPTPDVSQRKMLAVVAVLLLRVPLAWLIFGPFLAAIVWKMAHG